MNFLQAQQELLIQLKRRYDEREAATIAGWVMEKATGLKKMDRILRKNEPLPGSALDLLKKYSAELAAGRPVQYVLQESWFCGMKFYVDEDVLIPRPETEELVEWLAQEAANRKPQAASATAQAQNAVPFSVLDVGTGSGCIAIALAKRLAPAGSSPHSAATPSPDPATAPLTPRPEAPDVYACDISAEALGIARCNAGFHQALIEFRQIDFLDSTQWRSLPNVQAIISNPPYIPLKEKAAMAPHVVGFEPHLALFVEDKDPLLFYKALAAFANGHLLPGGALFVEIHEALAAPVMEVFREMGFPLITLRQDMQGADRMIKATR